MPSEEKLFPRPSQLAPLCPLSPLVPSLSSITSVITHPGRSQHVQSLNPEPYTPLTRAVANISSCDGAVTGRTEEWWCEIFQLLATCPSDGYVDHMSARERVGEGGRGKKREKERVYMYITYMYIYMYIKCGAWAQTLRHT